MLREDISVAPAVDAVGAQLDLGGPAAQLRQPPTVEQQPHVGATKLDVDSCSSQLCPVELTGSTTGHFAG